MDQHANQQDQEMNLIIVIQQSPRGDITIDFDQSGFIAGTQLEKEYALLIRELIAQSANNLCKALGGHGAMLTRGKPANQ